MKELFLDIAATLIAGILIMILHELPKSIAYNFMTKNQNNSGKRNIFKLHQYIDPIGLVLCVTSYSGFSKPYMYRIKDKKTNFVIGLTGLCSLFLVLVISIIFLRMYSNLNSKLQWSDLGFTFYFLRDSSILSCGMLLVNLFPVATFDVGLLIAGKSSAKYFSVIKNDYFIKMVLLLTVILGIISMISGALVQYLIGF